MIINLILGGVNVPVSASQTIEQIYTPLVAESILRMSDGSGVKQTAWGGKTKIETTGTGSIPVGLKALDYSVQMELSCVVPEIIDSVSHIIALPTTRRTDISPVAYAVVNGKSIRSSLSISGDTATIATITGATAYQIAYFPKFTVYASMPKQTGSGRTASFSWSLTTEQV